jgi:hypothetical protein
MPHPHFRTTWEENSYWKHYHNYMESKLDDEERESEQQQQEQSQKQSQQQSQKQSQQQQQSDEWTLVTRHRRHRGQNK